MMAAKEHQTVPLSVLLSRELANEKMEKPEILHGQAGQSKKGEDFTLLKTECQRVVGDGVTTYSVFGLFDGHNGSAAAIYTKENLLNNVIAAIPPDLNRDEWLAALLRALVAGFVKTDKDFQGKAQTSGTTVTFMIIEGWVITVASVGDSRCILESADGNIYYLSADHRLECNVEEVKRITASGGEVGRLNTGGGAEIGPLRCWPGGLCLSRSIGDVDVGEFIVPVPYVKQIKLSTAGGRLILSSDGVWDALSAEVALECCRGLPAEAAAAQIVKEAVQAKGLRDDTTCIVIDILPQEKPAAPLPAPKKQSKGVFKSMFRKKSSESTSQMDRDHIEPDAVEELYEEGSAMLSDRLDTKYPLCNMFKLFMCAVCQVEIKPEKGISIHIGSTNSRKMRPWDGPFLCSSCQEKKEAMEGKRSSGGTRSLSQFLITSVSLKILQFVPFFFFNFFAQIDTVVKVTRFKRWAIGWGFNLEGQQSFLAQSSLLQVFPGSTWKYGSMCATLKDAFQYQQFLCSKLQRRELKRLAFYDSVSDLKSE